MAGHADDDGHGDVDGGASRSRTGLSRGRVIDGAVALADRIGIDPLTIRKLATELGVRPMTIYHYVDNKDDIIDGMVDAVFAEIERPPVDLEWTEAMRIRCRSARRVLARHPWATALMETRTNPGPATLGHHDAVIACLRRAGMDWPLLATAYASIDAYVYGFALQEAGLPFETEAEAAEVATVMMEHFPVEAFPNLAAFTMEHVLQPGYNFAAEFDTGLDLVLDGLVARLRG
ncbi:MAG: TetR/AcrR family transcriptional regulator C-terminal domain-containing protein [Acidimicrobiia bacterium]|nr:TetR/AcrR family transcriptional regulator C-terminal domain-containing protein [Acidimicrobiia bacterium]